MNHPSLTPEDVQIFAHLCKRNRQSWTRHQVNALRDRDRYNESVKLNCHDLKRSSK